MQDQIYQTLISNKMHKWSRKGQWHRPNAPLIWGFGKFTSGGSIILKVVPTHCKDKAKQANKIELDMKYSKECLQALNKKV